MMRLFFTVWSFFTAIFLLLLCGILWTLYAAFGPIKNEIHRYTERQRLFKILRVSGRQRLYLSQRHVQDSTQGMNPCIDTPLARLKEECHHFLQRIDFVI